MTPVRYHEAAEDELLNEIGYLELRTKGLGRSFFAEVRRAESLIAKFPESAEEIRPGIRKRIFRKFRYSLIYTIEKDGVLILAVAHHKPAAGLLGRSKQWWRKNPGSRCLIKEGRNTGVGSLISAAQDN